MKSPPAIGLRDHAPLPSHKAEVAYFFDTLGPMKYSMYSESISTFISFCYVFGGMTAQRYGETEAICSFS